VGSGYQMNADVSDNDAELVARAMMGQQDACRVLAERFAAPVANLITRLVRDRGVAEELTQDAFIKVFRALPSFDPSYRLAPWVLRIAHNTAIDYLRRQRLDFVVISDDADEAGPRAVLVEERERSPFEHAHLADLRGALDWALGQLKPQYRRLIVLRYQEDLSYEDISFVLKLPLGTVKSHLHRARHAMAEMLEQAGWAPGGPEAETGPVKPGGHSPS
jgi:RNA polymerase sigma-70 factor (ECF subfamily)